jgi:hypothetical protein
MHRLAWLVSVLAVGCGGGGEGSSDAGADGASDVTHEKQLACDFPCRVPWGCIDSTHWVEMQSWTPPGCSSGQMCKSTGITHACDLGLECVQNPPPQSTVPCAYGGIEGCMPGDAGTFAPDAMAPAPLRQVGACDQVGIDQFWSRCLDPSTYDATACAYWQTNYKTCIACLGQTLVASAWSTDQNPAPVANVSGCYAFFGDTSCASKVDANMQCAAAVCKAGCETDAKAYAACITAARTTACASSFPLCDADAGSYATCEAPSLKDFFTAFGEALCGP